MLLTRSCQPIVDRGLIGAPNKREQCLNHAIHIIQLVGLQRCQAGWHLYIFCGPANSLHVRDNFRKLLSGQISRQLRSIVELARQIVDILYGVGQVP